MPDTLLTLDAAAKALGIPKVEVIRATLRQAGVGRELDKVNVPPNRLGQGRTMIDRESLERFARRRGLRLCSRSHKWRCCSGGESRIFARLGLSRDGGRRVSLMPLVSLIWFWFAANA